MNKSKLIGFIAIVLLLSNIALIAFIFLAPPRRPAHEGPRDIIIERLHFDQRQTEDYDKLIEDHRKSIRQKEGEMMQLKNRLYGSLTSGDTNSNDSLETAIGNIQIEIEKIHYAHFMDIGKLCNAGQKDDFDKLITEIAELFSRPMRRPPGKQ